MRDDPDQATSEELVEHGPYLASLATRLTRDADLAGDLVQDTWLAALRNPPRRSGPVRAWLATVMRHVHFNRVRHEARAAERRGRIDARIEECGADERAQDVELQGKLLRALATLDAPQREVLVLRHLDGLPPREIARRLGVPVETVRTRLKRGAERLRVALQQPQAERGHGLAGLLLLVRRPFDWLGRALRRRPRYLAGALTCAACLLLTLLFCTSNAKPWFAADAVDLASAQRASPVLPDGMLASLRAPSERTELRSLSARPAPSRGLELQLSWAADRSPAAHVRVALERSVGAQAQEPARFTESDDLGLVRIPELQQGRWIVSPWIGSSLRIDVPEGRALHVELELPPGHEVEGVVLRPRASRSFAQLELRCSFPGRPELQVRMAPPDLDGRFRLALVDQDAWIGARMEGFAPSALLQAALGIGHTQAEPALKLELGAQSKGPRTLELHVVDPAGKPVADAQVAWLSDGLSRVDAASGKLFRCTDDEPARSDARGVVSLTRQTASLGWIYVCAPGYAPCCVIPLRGPLRAPTQRIELQPECTITGHLLPSDARMRIEGLTIVATSPRLPHPLLTSSAADGSFLLRGLPAGPVLIEAGIDDGWPGAARLNLDLAPAEHRRRDLLLSSERTIQGKVLDPFDRPRAGWTVTLEDTRGPARLLEGLLAPRPGVRRTTTDAEGCFSFEGCAAVEHLVCAHPPRAAQGPGGHARIGPSNETACVRVGTQPGARVHGTFVCSDPAAFPDPHMLLASRMLEQVEVVSVDARTGYFEFAGLPEGEYVLGTLAPSRGIVHLQEFQLLPDSDLDLGRVAAPLSGKLRVLVHDPSGALLESVLVQLAPGGSAGAVKPGRQWTRQLLDAEGGFTREGILPGPYHLLVEWPGSGNLHKPVEVRAGETTVVELP